MAALYLLEGQAALAEQAMAPVPDDRRADHVLLYVLARAQAAMGKSENALASLRRAIAARGGGVAREHVLSAQLLRATRRPEEALWHLVLALRAAPADAEAKDGFLQAIGADDLPPATVMEGIRQVYAAQPRAPVVYDLVAALAQRPDARQMCDDWLRRHPKAAPEAPGGRNP